MSTWQEFLDSAPQISEVFVRRHLAAKKLCLMGTLRADGYPRISPIEPRAVAGHLWLTGMPGTAKLRDLERDPRFTLHTATTDNSAADGDAKLWGQAVDIHDPAMQRKFTQALFDDTGIDVRDQTIDHLYAADIHGASAIRPDGERLSVILWKPAHAERVVRQL